MASNFPRTMAAQTPQVAPMSEREQLVAEIARLEAAENIKERAQLEKKIEGLSKKEEGWYEDFAEGMGVSGLELWYGMKDLVGEMDDEDKATLMDWKKDAGESGWGTAGQVVGEIAQFIVPGGVALKGLKGASKLKGLAKAYGATGIAVTEAGVGAGLGATRLPEAGETRGENAALEGALGLAGAGAGKLLEKGVRGLTKTRAAQQMLDEGIPLTPGQQAASPIVKSAEKFLDFVPTFSRAGVEGRQEALEGWNKRVLNKAAPSGTEITEIGTAGGKQLETAVKKGYDDAWEGAGRLSQKTGQALLNRLQASLKKLGLDDSQTIENAMQDVEAMLTKRNPKTSQAMDDILRRAIKSASGKHELRVGLEKTRKSLRNRMPAKNRKALRAMDAKYPAYLTARKAIGKADTKGGVFNPNQLTRAVTTVGKGKGEIGEGALQEASDIGREVIGANMAEPFPGAWRSTVRGLPPMGAKSLGNMVMGETGVQKGIAKNLLDNPRAAAIRRIASPARLATTGDTAFQDDRYRY